jgi:hypothetical protein
LVQFPLPELLPLAELGPEPYPSLFFRQVLGYRGNYQFVKPVVLALPVCPLSFFEITDASQQVALAKFTALKL